MNTGISTWNCQLPAASFLNATSSWPCSSRYANGWTSSICIDPLKGSNGELRKFEEVQPFAYRELHGQDEVAFKKDAAGNWQFQVEIPVFIFQRVGLLENKYFNLTILIFGLSVIALTVLLWPVAAILRKHYAHPLELTAAERRQRLLVRLVSILFVCLF